jgi:hypothetical protein
MVRRVSVSHAADVVIQIQDAREKNLFATEG